MGIRKIPPVVLAFGGFDPTGGAGILMDAKAVHSAGGYAVAVPSCLAVQTTASFQGIVPLRREALDRSLKAAAASYRIGAVKVGMVGTRSAALAILSFLEGHAGLPVVVDPVLRSSSGAPLLARNALPPYRRVLSRATVLTPNLPEIEKILDRRVGSFGEAIAAAKDLSRAAGAAVLLKGGHFPWKGRRGTDILFEDGRLKLLGPSRKSFRGDPHGTGCALSSCIAARLAAGEPLADAARKAKSALERMARGGFPSSEGRWTLLTPVK
jgi:hydroxymethylpyrimidine kinase/phosphomethylpyrimidine kinase